MPVLNYRKAVKGAKKLVIRGDKFDTFSGPDCTLDSGHFFHTSLTQCLVFLVILQGQESKI